MKTLLNFVAKNLTVLVLVLFAALSFGVVIESRDPVGFLGWIFCFCIILTVGPKPPSNDFVD